jgi:hypothetical protein
MARTYALALHPPRAPIPAEGRAARLRGKLRQLRRRLAA